MSEQITLNAFFEFNPGKRQRFQELIEDVARHVKAEEPAVLAYELAWGKADASGEITEAVVTEKYANQAGLETHREAAYSKAMLEAVEKEGLVKSLKVVITGADKIGFSSRS